ncbi:MAG: NADP-dependent oxidoreductase [Halieaceae bacterium]
MSLTNRKIVLDNYPSALPTADAMRLETVEAREPEDGEILVAVDAVSIDAWIGTTMSPGWLHQMIPLEATVPALGVGRVLASGSSEFAEGDAVFGALCAQTHATVAASDCHKIDVSQVPLSAYLGLLSPTTGFTSFFGIRDVGQVKAGDTVLVSAAAGAVGTTAGQMARLEGATTVIGIAGGPEKCRFLTEVAGFDAAIDYKGEDIDARLKEIAPEGIDVFFDNVGGEMLDVVLEHIRERARVVICGAISQYADNQNVYGPTHYLRLAERYARMEGFTAFHFEDRYHEAAAAIAQWIAEGKITQHEQVETGLESFPGALEMLFTGGNTGKLLVQIS